MSRRIPANVGASVRRRLLDRARRERSPFQLLLEHFAIERLLFRLQESKYAGRLSAEKPRFRRKRLLASALTT